MNNCENCGSELRTCGKCGWSKVYEEDMSTLKADLGSLEGIVKAAVIPCHICLQNGCDCNVTPLWDFATGDMVVRQYNEIEQLKAENERLKEIDERECLIAISIKKERDNWLRKAGENGKFYMDALKENEQLKAGLKWIVDVPANVEEFERDSDVLHAVISYARECLKQIGGTTNERQ